METEFEAQRKEQEEQCRHDIQVGEMLERLLTTKEWQIFDDFILEQILQDAIETFWTLRIVEDPDTAVQVQKMGGMITKIRGKVQEKIQAGKDAHIELQNLNSTREGEEEIYG